MATVAFTAAALPHVALAREAPRLVVDNETGLILENVLLRSAANPANRAKAVPPAHWMTVANGVQREIGAGMNHGTVVLLFDQSKVGSRCLFDVDFDFGSRNLTRHKLDVCKGTHVSFTEADVRNPNPPRAAIPWVQVTSDGASKLWVAMAPNMQSASEDKRIRYVTLTGGCPGGEPPDECDVLNIDNDTMPAVVDCSASSAVIYFSVFGRWRRLTDPA
ncbi:MAG: hypothetical protein J2O44_02965, partial [Porphyrobacter sp.]|nr:hypothetical protein [Porphyrobacter sp.]